jgi:hypothetical protein
MFKKAAAVTVVSALALAAPVAVRPAAAQSSTLFRSTPASGWRVNGEVHAVAVVGGTAYVGGTFAAITTTDGGTSLPRVNLAAFDLATGEPTPFAVGTDGPVEALASDGSGLYVGGLFTTVAGANRKNLARVALATGAVDNVFKANTNRAVYSLDASGGPLFLGGDFTKVGSASRTRVAAVDKATGTPLAFNTQVDKIVYGIRLAPSGTALYLAGRFTQVNSQPRGRMAAVDAATGANSAVVFPSITQTVNDLDVSPDGGHLYAAVAGSANSAGSWNTMSGAREWYRSGFNGDMQAVEYRDGNVYVGFHGGYGGDTSLRLLAADAGTGAIEATFRPTVNGVHGVNDIDSGPGVLAIGGDFDKVSTQKRAGVAWFLPAPPPVVALDASSAWRFQATGTDLGAASTWAAPGFDDSTWATGAGHLGFGDGDENTIVNGGPAGARFPTVYFRTTFNVGVAVDNASLSLVLDDGAVVYLNGVELGRSNMPAGPIGYGTLTPNYVENAPVAFTIPANLLLPGANTLAVEVHQNSVTSSDLSFAANLQLLPV